MGKSRSLIILCLDILAILAILSTVYYWRLSKMPSFNTLEPWLITFTIVSSLFFAGTYFRERRISRPTLPIRTFFVCLVGGALCVGWLYVLGPEKFNQYFGRGVLTTAVVLIGVAATVIRYLVNLMYHRQESGVSLLYLGYSESCKAFLQELKNHGEVRSVCIISDEIDAVHQSGVTLVSPDALEATMRESWHSVIIDPKHHASETETQYLIEKRLSGTPVLSLADYYEMNWYMIPVDHIGDDWFLRSQGFSMLGSPVSNRIKRASDILMSCLLLLVSAPLLLICAVIIKLDSTGNVLFAQTRIGLNGKPFTIYKLRTMISDAEKDGAQWAEQDDHRITRIGRFLRASRLDELPQCWNVFIGEMSFVGPRPERPEFTAKLAEKIPYYDLRHIVKPGISGWAQVIFAYGASEEDALRKLQYELYYIKNQSFLMDINVLLRTAFTVFQRVGR